MAQTRTHWAVDVWTGGAWVATGYIYAPNESFTIGHSATQGKVKLADGGNGYINPEVAYVREQLTFQWLEIANTDAFKSQVENYVKNQTILRLTDSLGNQYSGTFVKIDRVWLLAEANFYDIAAVFERSLG